MFWKRSAGCAVVLVVASLVLAGCGGGSAPRRRPPVTTGRRRPAVSSPPKKPYVAPQFRHRIPGMPPVIDNDIYSQTRAGMLAPQVRHDPQLLYVPDSQGSTVTVINQQTHQIVRTIPTGYLSQHVVPSYDLRTLYHQLELRERAGGHRPAHGDEDADDPDAAALQPLLHARRQDGGGDDRAVQHDPLRQPPHLAARSRTSSTPGASAPTTPTSRATAASSWSPASSPVSC